MPKLSSASPAFYSALSASPAFYRAASASPAFYSAVSASPSESGFIPQVTWGSRSAATPSKSFEQVIRKLAGKKTGRNVYHSIMGQMLRNYMVAALEFVRESAGVTTVAGNQAINAMFFHILAEYLKKKGLPESELRELRSIVGSAIDIVGSETRFMSSAEKAEAVREARRSIKEVTGHFGGRGAQGGGGKSPADLAKDSLPALRARIRVLEKGGMPSSRTKERALVEIVSDKTGVKANEIHSLLVGMKRGGTRSPKRTHAPSLLSTLKGLFLGAAALGLPGAAAQQPSPTMAPSIQYKNGPGALAIPGGILKNIPAIPDKFVTAPSWGSQLQGFLAPKKGMTLQEKVGSVASARAKSDAAMSEHPTTRGVIPWIKTQSLTAILKYVKHSNPGYTITSSRVPPENPDDYVPIESAKDQINLLHQPNYFLGNIVVETTGNYQLSDDIKEFVGYTGKQGSEKPPIAIWIEIVKASGKSNVAKAIAERDALKDAIATLEKEHAAMLEDISEKTAVLANIVNGDSVRATVEGSVLKSVGFNAAASYVNGIVGRRQKGIFSSGTPVDDDEDDERASIYAPAGKSPITVTHTKEIGELVDLHQAVAKAEKHLESKRVELQEKINRGLDNKEVVVKIHVPASKFNTHLRELMKIYLMGDNSRLTEGIIAMPDFPWDIYHVGFYKPEQMEAAVGPMAMLQTLDRRKEWGTQEWAALAEAYGNSMGTHLDRVERLNVAAVEKAMSTGLVTVQEGQQLMAVHSQATTALGLVRDLVSAETAKTSDNKFRGIVEAYVKDVTLGPEHVLNEAESEVIHAVGKRAGEATVETLNTIDKAASDIAAATAAGLTLLTKMFRFSTAFAPMFGFLLFLDITVFTVIESEADKERFFTDIKMTTWTAAGASAATGLLAYVGFMFGGLIGAAALPWVLGSGLAVVGGMKVKFVFDILKFFIGAAGGTLGTFLLIHAERITFDNTVLGLAGIVAYTGTRAGYEMLRAYARRRNAPPPALLAPVAVPVAAPVAMPQQRARSVARAPAGRSRSRARPAALPNARSAYTREAIAAVEERGRWPQAPPPPPITFPPYSPEAIARSRFLADQRGRWPGTRRVSRR